MSYRQARRSKQAEQYFKQREAEQRDDPVAARDEAQLKKSRAWLEEYHAGTIKPKDTSSAEEIREEGKPQSDHEGCLGEA